jgi:hypothetical protein
MTTRDPAGPEVASDPGETTARADSQPPRGSAEAAAILKLQRAVGNRAVARLVAAERSPPEGGRAPRQLSRDPESTADQQDTAPGAVQYSPDPANWWQRLLHGVGLRPTKADRVREARNFWKANPNILMDGEAIDPDKLSDDEVLHAYNRYLEEIRRLSGGGQVDPSKVVPAAVMTPWGWQGSPQWRKARDVVKSAGTHEDVLGKVPTEKEARMLIEESGGTVDRVDGPHDPPNPHQYDHINYTTAGGDKATVKIQR